MRALRAIIMDDSMKDITLNGTKKITIREGHRDYTLGPVVIVGNNYDWCVPKTITNVRLACVLDVTKEELLADGFENHAELFECLGKFYPNLNTASLLTIIRWE